MALAIISVHFITVYLNTKMPNLLYISPLIVMQYKCHLNFDHRLLFYSYWLTDNKGYV